PYHLGTGRTVRRDCPTGLRLVARRHPQRADGHSQPAGADPAQPGGGQADPRILYATDPVVFPPQTTTAPAGAVVVAWFALSVFDGTHRGGVEAAVDVENFATDARGQVGAEEG